MFDGFNIQNNYSLINPTFNIEKNCKISKNITNRIRGGQIYARSSQIKIHGGSIRNSNNNINVNINVAPEEEELKQKFDISNIGGGIIFEKSNNIEINNLKIEKCNSKTGGAICLDNSSMKISNSELNNNFSEVFGGAIYSGDNCELEVYNTKIINNTAQDKSGGGIYSSGNLIIDGENTLIANNECGSSGGGIINKNNGLIKNCVICNNKAKNSGGGIFNEGNLLLEKAKIYLNSCGILGGGICYSSNKKFLYDKNTIDSMVYDNIAKKGNNLYPEIN